MAAKVSVVVPVYNVEKYLVECLDSIKGQTLKDIEIICVDDGSSDRSSRILDQFAQEDERFHVIHKQNEGYGKAMNVGIETAAAPYIGIVESDDMILPDMYEKLLALMEEKQVEVLKADHYEFYRTENGEYIEYYVPLTEDKKLKGSYGVTIDIQEHEEALLFDKHTWTGLYSRDFLEREHIKHNETPGASHQDVGFWFQTMVKAKRIYFTDQAFYRYRIDNPGCSMLSGTKPFAICDEYEHVDEMLDKLGNKGKAFYKWSAYYKITECMSNIYRMEDRFKVSLAEHIKDDLFEALREGHIDADLYDDHQKANIFDLIADPKKYIEKGKARRRRIEDAVNDYEVIILYGAGKVGYNVLQILWEGRIHTKVKFFAVTEKEKEPRTIAGIPVKGIDELQEYKEKALVIITVGKRYRAEIEEVVFEKKFQNHIYYDRLLYK